MRAKTRSLSSLVAVAAVLALLLPSIAGAEWGGVYTASTGESVRIMASDALARDEAANLAVANLMASFPHGPEIATITVYRAPFSETNALCGNAGASGCYSNLGRRLVFSTEPAYGEQPAEILAHEYGHHILESQQNEPYPAWQVGTRRWATAMHVCERARAGELFPGAQTPRDRYLRNPAEAFAETYRLLVAQMLGWTPVYPWIVDPLLMPDATALELVRQDVMGPAQQRTERRKLTLRAGRSRTLTFTVPLDGDVTVSIAGKASAVARSGGRVVGRGKYVPFTACGDRSWRVTVKPARRTATRVTVMFERPVG